MTVQEIQNTNGDTLYINYNHIVRIEKTGFVEFSDDYESTIFMIDKTKIKVYGYELNKYIDRVQVS